MPVLTGRKPIIVLEMSEALLVGQLLEVLPEEALIEAGFSPEAAEQSQELFEGFDEALTEHFGEGWVDLDTGDMDGPDEVSEVGPA